MAIDGWVFALGVTREAIDDCLARSKSEALIAFDELKAEAKRRYRAFARQLHPDLAGSDGEELKKLNEAWAVVESSWAIIDGLLNVSESSVLTEAPVEPETRRVTVLGSWIRIN